MRGRWALCALALLPLACAKLLDLEASVPYAIEAGTAAIEAGSAEGSADAGDDVLIQETAYAFPSCADVPADRKLLCTAEWSELRDAALEDGGPVAPDGWSRYFDTDGCTLDESAAISYETPKGVVENDTRNFSCVYEYDVPNFDPRDGFRMRVRIAAQASGAFTIPALDFFSSGPFFSVAINDDNLDVLVDDVSVFAPDGGEPTLLPINTGGLIELQIHVPPGGDNATVFVDGVRVPGVFSLRRALGEPIGISLGLNAPYYDDPTDGGPISYSATYDDLTIIRY